MKHDNNLMWFDFSRGSAAILVLINHSRALVFDEFSAGSRNILHKIFFFIAGFGHEAVVLFFVLSGFFIIRSIHESMISKRWNVREYIINRITRLWLVLIPALLLSLLWDTIGLNNFSTAYTYTGTIKSLPEISPTGKLGMDAFLGNMFFLQTIKFPTYGSNGALWSLANEFWYYLIFPLFYFSIVKFYNRIIRILLLMLALLSLFFVGSAISIYFLVWLMGGVAYIFIKNSWFSNKNLTAKFLILFLIFMGTLAGIRFKLAPTIFNDFSLGAVTALFLCILAKVPMQNRYLRITTKTFSDISYTLYLTHFSFAILIVSGLLNHRVAMNGINFLFYLLFLLLILTYSYGIYYLFERNTGMVKNIVRKLFKSKVA